MAKAKQDDKAPSTTTDPGLFPSSDTSGVAQAEKKTKKKTAKKAAAKKGKRINVELAPGIYRLLKQRVTEANSSPDLSAARVTYGDLVNEALNRYLPPAPQSDASRD